MTKISLSSDIQGIFKLLGKRLKHSKEIQCSFGTFTLYPITDMTIAIYSRGEFTKNVGEIDPFSFAERVIFKGISILLEKDEVLILNKQDYTVQQTTSVDEISEVLNSRYLKMDKTYDLDPCTSESYYNQMLGYKFIDISDKEQEILEQLEKGLKERQRILAEIEELEGWLEKFNQKIKDGKTITLPELDKRDSKKAELESLKKKLKDLNFRPT
jgi:hypothetical protein